MTSSNASLILGLFCTQCVRQVIAINGLIRLPRLHVPDLPPCWGGKMVFMEKDSLTFENNFCWPVEEFLLIENGFCQQLIAFYWAVADAAIADTDADRNDCSTIIVAWGFLFLGEVLQAQPGLHGLSEAGSSPCHRRVPIPGFHITRSNKLPKVKCPMSSWPFYWAYMLATFFAAVSSSTVELQQSAGFPWPAGDHWPTISPTNHHSLEEWSMLK